MEDEDYVRLILEVVPQTIRSIKTEMRAAAHQELTVPQFRVFNRLSKSVTTNSELAEWMGVSAPTMSRMVDGLVKRKLVRRLVQSGDRRQVHLELTARGKAKFGEISAVVRGKFAELVAVLDAEQKLKLGEGLQVLGELFAKGVPPPLGDL
jgi:DNA-binding MarR family transcriptional regulator